MKENYQIYLPYQFRLRDQSAGRDPQLSHKKMKTLFLSNMSKSRRLTSTFFPISCMAYLTKKDFFSCFDWKWPMITTFLARRKSPLLEYDWEKSRSQSSTFWHIWEKYGFHFLIRKFRISLWPPIKLIRWPNAKFS